MYIAGIAREVLEGNMREIVGRMRLEEMVSDRQNFSDNNGVIDDLGIDNISRIKKGWGVFMIPYHNMEVDAAENNLC